jgi:alpha-L-rhamnosidase
VPGLEQFEATHKGPYGTIVSSWEKQRRSVEYKVEIPANSSATLYLDEVDIREGGKPLRKNELIKVTEYKNGKVVLKLKSGKYLFTID